MPLTRYCCRNCGFWQPRFDVPTTCPVCEDYRHPLPPDGYVFADAEAVAAGRTVTIDEPLPGLHRFRTEPQLGIGSCGYLLEHPGGNVHFDGCGWYDDTALRYIAERGGVRVLAASHAHVFGALWRVVDHFEPETVFQAEALPFTQAFRVARAFDDVWALHGRTDAIDEAGSDGPTLYRSAGHTPDHTVLHDPDRGWLFCGDALKFTFHEPGRTVGTPDSVSCHKAFDAHIPLTRNDLRRYRDLFASLAFDVVITPWEVVTAGGRDAALTLIEHQLDHPPNADRFPLSNPGALCGTNAGAAPDATPPRVAETDATVSVPAPKPFSP